MLMDEGDRLTRVVVCTPRSEYFQVKNPEAHNIIELADVSKAIQQHDRLKDVLVASGCEVIDIQELGDHPNSVFTRDTALCTPGGYVKLRMGLPTRRGEEEWMAQILESLGEPCVGSITAPGTAEGGDVILAGSVAFVGRSARTNDEGVEQISAFLEDVGYKVRSARVPKPYLHIGGVMSLVGPELVLCCRGVLPDSFFDGFETIEVSENTSTSANVICLCEEEVIADSSNRGAIEELQQAGIRVHSVKLSEFLKGAGGPSCLIMPVERIAA